MQIIHRVNFIHAGKFLWLRFESQASKGALIFDKQKGRSIRERPVYYPCALIFVVAVGDFSEQSADVAAVELGIVQFVGFAPRVLRDLADFDFAFDAHAQRFGDFLHPR